MLDAEDNCWTSDDYRQVLESVEEHLWLFVQENAALHRPRQIVGSLAQLSLRDVRLLQCVHFLLSPTVQKCLHEDCPLLLQRLAQSNGSATTEARGAVKGNIDWNQTLKRRMSRGYADPTLFVTRTPVKVYDLPEMQALKYLLTQITALCLEALGGIPPADQAQAFEEGQKWKRGLAGSYHFANTLLKHVSLRNVQMPEKITDRMLQRVRCARNNRFQSVYHALTLFRNLFVRQQPEALRASFAEGVLKPLSQDTLYELYVLFQTMARLEKRGWQRDALRLVGSGKGTIAHYAQDGAAVGLYYQTLPAAFAGKSLYADLLRKHGIDPSLRRPDMVLEFHAGPRQYMLLEVKRTKNKSYIVDSLYKVFGYLKDFGHFFDAQPLPHALLVLWSGAANADLLQETVVMLNGDNFGQMFERILATRTATNT